MIIFVGDKPSSIMKSDAKPFEGAKSEARLTEWILLVKAPGMKFYVVNQCDTGSLTGMVVFAHIYGYPIVALGNIASKALGKVKHFKLPHPSGLNRQVNNQKYKEKKSETLPEMEKYIEKALSIQPTKTINK